MIFSNTIALLRRVNRSVALAVGAILALTVVFILLDISLRQIGHSFGGSDEISGYVMAIVASWGLAYALVELAHVRIDMLRQQMGTPGKCIMDLFAMLSLTVVALVVAFHAWPVLSKSIARGSHANTALETPLWIPQALWFTGWVWFALTATILLLCAIGLLIQHKTTEFDKAIGMGDQA